MREGLELGFNLSKLVEGNFIWTSLKTKKYLRIRYEPRTFIFKHKKIGNEKTYCLYAYTGNRTPTCCLGGNDANHYTTHAID